MDPADTNYRVITNGEEQYSIWAAVMALPQGWRDGGFVGSRQDCLAHIESVWSDLRPRPLRMFEQQAAASTVWPT